MKRKSLFYTISIIIITTAIVSCSEKTPLSRAKIQNGDISLGKKLYYEGREGVIACNNCHGKEGVIRKSGRKLPYTDYSKTTFDLILAKLTQGNIRNSYKMNVHAMKQMNNILSKLNSYDKRSLARFIAYKLYSLDPGEPLKNKTH